MTSALQQSSPASWSQGSGRERGAGQDPLRFMTDYKAPERNPITQDSCAARHWPRRIDRPGEREALAAEPVAQIQTQRATSSRGAAALGSEHDIMTQRRLKPQLRSPTRRLNSLCPTYFTTWIYMHPANCFICLIRRNVMLIKFQPAHGAEWEREAARE